MVSTRRGPLLECRWRTVGSKRRVVLDDSMGRNRTNRSSLWYTLDGPQEAPNHRRRSSPAAPPVARQGLWKIHRRHPSVSSGPCFFFSMWGLRVALRLQRAASRAAACGRRTGCGQLDARLTPRSVLLFEEAGSQPLTPLFLAPPHVALGPMATDLRWHRPGVPF